jgi:hypothetical protein
LEDIKTYVANLAKWLKPWKEFARELRK